MIFVTIISQYTDSFHKKMKLNSRHFKLAYYHHKLEINELDDYIKQFTGSTGMTHTFLTEELTDELNDEYFRDDDFDEEDFDEEENE